MLAPAGGSPEATDVDAAWYFCPALDAFQVELGADMRDAFLSPSKQVAPLQSDAVLPVLQATPPSSSPAKPCDAPAPTTASHDNNCRTERRPSSSSSDDSGMADDDDDDDAHGVDELSTSTGEPQTTGRWTKKEHELFLEGLRRYGKSWKSISNLVVTRTLVQIRTHAQKYLQKQSRSAKAVFPFGSGASHPPRHPLPFHQHALHLAMQPPPPFLMHHQHLRWGMAHDPAAVAYQQDAIYRQLMQQQHRQHIHTDDNNALDQLLDHSDDDSDDPDNNAKSNEDDDDDELQHMMMECETTGKRRSSAPAMSQPSVLKHLAPSPDVTRSLKRRRVDAMQHKHTAMAYLDPAVTYGKPTPSHALSSLSFTHQPAQQHLETPFGSVLRSPQLI